MRKLLRILAVVTPMAMCAAVAIEAPVPAIAITGGDPVAEGSAPWMANLSYNKDGTVYVLGCGGALIARSWVVTARHCITESGINENDIGVQLGETHVQHGVPVGDFFHPAANIFLHSSENYADLALIELLTPASTPHLQLLGRSDNDLARKGSDGYIYGYSGEGEGFYLNKALQPIRSNNKTALCYPFGFDRNTGIGAGYNYGKPPRADAGDSGGPLVVATKSGALRLAGTLFGTPAGGDCWDVYMNLMFGNELREWMTSVMATQPPHAVVARSDSKDPWSDSIGGRGEGVLTFGHFGCPELDDLLFCDNAPWQALDYGRYIWKTKLESADEAQNGTANAPITFEESFTLIRPSELLVEVAADNIVEVFLNGAFVSSGQNTFGNPLAVVIDAPEGANSIRFNVENVGCYCTPWDNPAGLAYQVTVL